MPQKIEEVLRADGFDVDSWRANKLLTVNHRWTPESAVAGAKGGADARCRRAPIRGGCVTPGQEIVSRRAACPLNIYALIVGFLLLVASVAIDSAPCRNRA